MKISFSTRIDESLHRELQIACAKRGITVQQMAEEAFKQWLGHDDANAEMAARFLKWMKAKNHGPVEQKLKGWVVDCLTPGALPDPDPE